MDVMYIYTYIHIYKFLVNYVLSANQLIIHFVETINDN